MALRIETGVRGGTGGDDRHLDLFGNKGEVLKSVPVYNVRDPRHHEKIARAIASGDPGAFDVGIIGILIAVEDPRGNLLLKREQAKQREESEKGNSDDDLIPNEEKFWRIKVGRPSSAKVPFMATPRIIPDYVDFDKLHPEFRHLKDRQARERLYKHPLHVIWPVNDNPKIHRGAFVTTAQDSKNGNPEKPDRWVSEDTVCIFVPGTDPDWRFIGERAGMYNPHALFGVTSFNLHGELPPFNDEELVSYLERRGPKDLEFEFFVHDPIAKASGLKSSHTQVRLPLVGEEPEIVVVRRGPVAADDIRRWTGYPTRVLESAALAKPASRAASEDADLFPNIECWMREAQLNAQQRDKFGNRLRLHS